MSQASAKPMLAAVSQSLEALGSNGEYGLKSRWKICVALSRGTKLRKIILPIHHHVELQGLEKHNMHHPNLKSLNYYESIHL